MPSTTELDSSNLTQRQWSLWAAQQLEPDVPLYNMVLTFSFHGDIDKTCFAQAFQALLNSSDVLRSVFDAADGVPQRRVTDPYDSPLIYLDLSTASDPRQALDRWVAERCVQMFDLSNRLFDTALLKISAKEFVRYINQHHLITDGWSEAVIYQNMADFYRHIRSGGITDAPVVPAYDAYAAFERDNRGSRQHRAAQDYWREKLQIQVPRTRFYHSLPQQPASPAVRISCPLGAERSAAIRSICTEKGVFF